MRSFKLSDGVLGAGMAALSLLFLVGVVTGVLRGALTHSPNDTVKAAFADTRQVKRGTPVRVAGVDVGRVERLDLSPDHRTNVVTMKIDAEDVGPLAADATAHIRFRTLLGGAFYVDLDRGTPGVAPLGGRTIPVTRTDSQVELDDLTTLVKGDVRRGLLTLPDQLGVALADPATPTAAIRGVAHASPSLAAGLRDVRGSEPGSDLETLIAATARTTRALDAPGGQLRTLVGGAASLVRTTAARRADLGRLFDVAPGALRTADVTLDRLDRTLTLADPVLDDLSDAAPDVAPTVARLRGLVLPADRLLGDAVPLLRSLRPAVTSLAAASRRGVPLLDAIDPVLGRLDKTVLPYTGKEEPENEHSMAEMVGPGISALAGIGSYLDSNGRYVRFPVSSGNSSFYLPCQIFANNPDATKLVTCQSLGGSIKDLYGLDVKGAGR